MKKLDRVAAYWKEKLEDSFRLAPCENVFFPKLLDLAKKSSTILEVGVGKGRMVKVLRENGVDAEFYGIDINDNAKNSGTIGLIGDARKLPYENNVFDLVYSLGVVEHFPETALAVREHARVVKKGGNVLVTTPHLYVFTLRRYLDYLMHERKMGSFEAIRGRNIRLNTMKRYFEEADLCIQDCGVYGSIDLRGILSKEKMRGLRGLLQKQAWAGAYLYVFGTKR